MKLFAVLLTPCTITAHSWAACTKYNTQDTNYLTLGKFEHSKCLGYPRNYQNQLVNEKLHGWAKDTGYEWETDQCRTSFDNNDYSDNTPMAIYYSNEIIHISHPAKGHVADQCTDAYIPSTSMKLFMSTQPTVDTFDIAVTMIGEDHKYGQIDHLGFQNCFDFCADTDRSHCITSWHLPSITQTGRYSFKWIWEFNSKQYYTTCFDAMILIKPNTSLNVSTIEPTIKPNVSTIEPISEPTIVAPNSSIPKACTDPPSPTPISSTPMSSTYIPTDLPINIQTNIPSSTTRMPITSDASSVTSIINELFKSIKLKFNGTMDINLFN